jgi:indole-3-glycerol phosphate synthase
MPAILDEIVAVTRRRVWEASKSSDGRALERACEAHSPRGFRKALEAKAVEGTAVIAELKKASPSRGAIRADFQVAELARELERAGAAALSVLTEEQFFQGSLANLREASAATRLPCLRKDFIVDEWQLVEARANRADAVLLIAAVLSDPELRTLLGRSRELGLDMLCEVHDEAELERALQAGAEVIGVNSRDLRTFEVNLGTALRLGPKIPEGVLRVAESGINSGEDLGRLMEAGFRAFLIGEALMRAANPGEELRRLVETADLAQKRKLKTGD